MTNERQYVANRDKIFKKVFEENGYTADTFQKLNKEVTACESAGAAHEKAADYYRILGEASRRLSESTESGSV